MIHDDLIAAGITLTAEQAKARRKARKAEWYKKNKRKIAARMAVWRKKNKRKIAAQMAAYRERHKRETAIYIIEPMEKKHKRKI
jgi:hypothetical protein